MSSFLSLKMNCHGVSSDDFQTFFVPFMVLSFASNSLDTFMSSESFLGSSTVSLSPIAFDPGGPFLSTSETTLYHLDSNTWSFSSMTFSRVNTSLCPAFLRTSRFVSCTAALARFPPIEIFVYFISGYQMNIFSMPSSSFTVIFVFCPTGPVTLKLV